MTLQTMWTTRVIVVGVLVLATTTALCTNASVELGPSGEEDQAHCGLCHLVRARKEEKRNADHVDAWLRSGETRGVGSSYPLTQVPVLLLLCVFCDLTTREMYLNVCSVYIFV